MRRAVFLVVLTARAAGPPADFAEFARRLVEFDQRHVEMLRAWCQWGPEAPTDGGCSLDPAKLDYALYFRARSAAKRFYDLTER